MYKEIEIKTGKLEEDEKLIYASKVSTMRHDTEDLEFYNEANYFVIKKLYSEGYFLGYAVIFLGYNGLDSNDVSLERLFVNEHDLELVDAFIREIVKPDGYPIRVENFYCTDDRLRDTTYQILEKYGIEKVSRKR